jgi:hypothetical protein
MGMGDCRACRLGCECRRGASGHDHSDLPPDQIGRQRRQAIDLILGPMPSGIARAISVGLFGAVKAAKRMTLKRIA